MAREDRCPAQVISIVAISITGTATVELANVAAVPVPVVGSGQARHAIPDRRRRLTG